MKKKKIIFSIFFWRGWNNLIFLEGDYLPHFFCTNLLLRVKLGYTPNFTALGHLEVCGGVIGWWWINQWSLSLFTKLSWVELNWVESWSILNFKFSLSINLVQISLYTKYHRTSFCSFWDSREDDLKFVFWKTTYTATYYFV